MTNLPVEHHWFNASGFVVEANWCLRNSLLSLSFSLFLYLPYKMPSIQDKNETEDDEMDQDTSDSDKPDDDDSESGSGTENEESSGWWILSTLNHIKVLCFITTLSSTVTTNQRTTTPNKPVMQVHKHKNWEYVRVGECL